MSFPGVAGAINHDAILKVATSASGNQSPSRPTDLPLGASIGCFERPVEMIVPRAVSICYVCMYVCMYVCAPNDIAAMSNLTPWGGRGSDTEAVCYGAMSSGTRLGSEYPMPCEGGSSAGVPAFALEAGMNGSSVRTR